MPEMLAVDQRQPPLAWAEVGTGGIQQADQLHLRAWQSLQALPVTNLPPNFYLRMRLHPQPGSIRFGLRLRGRDNFASGYDLTIHIPERMVRLHNEAIYAVNGLDQPFTLEAVVKDDIIDVCIDQRRCIVNRCSELHGDSLFFFAHNAEVHVDEIEIRPWKTAVG